MSAAAAGLALASFSAPWLIAVGGVCIAGAWLYTGGSKPYGYLGLGEVAVFVFFGLVAVLGTQYTQALRVDWVGLALAVAIGSLSSAVLVANNLRDIPTDREVRQDHPGGAARRRPHPAAVSGRCWRSPLLLTLAADARHAVVRGRADRGAAGGAGGAAGAHGRGSAGT